MTYTQREDNSLKDDAIKFRAISKEVAKLAKNFWQALANSPHLSDNFKSIAMANLGLG